MNRQPFYHRATVLFTTTDPMSEEDFTKLVERALQERHNQYVSGSFEVEEYADPEPGDPADLM